MKIPAKWLRLLELALALAGVSLLGVGFAATAQRWNYQARQERALFRSTQVVASSPAVQAGEEAPPLAETDPDLDPLVLGTLKIPRLGLEAIVREGEDDATLDLAVGHIPGTAKPGQPGNAVLAAHRDTFFRKLRHIELDDRISLFVPPHLYEYRVISTQVVAPTEISVLEPHGIEELTLLTCFPFDFIGSAPKRFVVRATRLEPTPIPPSRSKK